VVCTLPVTQSNKQYALTLPSADEDRSGQTQTN
jgi:hypothetical protein